MSNQSESHEELDRKIKSLEHDLDFMHSENDELWDELDKMRHLLCHVHKMLVAPQPPCYDERHRLLAMTMQHIIRATVISELGLDASVSMEPEAKS